MQGIVSRMKRHKEICRTRHNEEHNETPIPKKTVKITKFLSSTDKNEKHELDMKVERYIYATNTPFLHVEHDAFKDLCKSLTAIYR